MTPLITIIIPSYNSADYIIDTLQSIDNQTYKEWECIIVNDGSTDSTEKVVMDFIENSANSNKFIYHYQKNRGLSGARNKGLRLSKGKYIQFIDSDDILFQDKLEVMISQYSESKEFQDVYFCDYMFSNDDAPFKENKTQYKLYKNISGISPVNFQKIYNEWDYYFVIPPHCFLYPKELISNYFFDEKLKSKEDWDFYLSLLKGSNIRFVGIDKVMCSYRVRKNSMSQDYTNLIRYTFAVLNKWRGKNYWSYLNRMSYYLLQAYIYRYAKRKNTVNMKIILAQIKEMHPTFFMLMLSFLYILMPVQLVKKYINIIRVRIK